MTTATTSPPQHRTLTGYLGSNATSLPPQYPSAGSIIAKLQGARKPGIPAYVGLPTTHSVGLVPGYHGAAYLGVGFNPFSADGDPNSDSYQVPNLGLPGGVDGVRAEGRRGLLGAFDRARRDVDASGLMAGLDQFDREAFSIVLGQEARRAFNLSEEDPRLRDRYGRHQWCQRATGAGLVQAGVRFVTLTFGGWDFHEPREWNEAGASTDRFGNWHIDRGSARSWDAGFDHGAGDGRVRTDAPAEHGRRAGSGPCARRDHWGNVMSVLAAGGGLRGDGSWARRMRKARYPKTGRCVRRICWSRCIVNLASTRAELYQPGRAADFDRVRR